ncbi:lytic murein transglycosylase [Anianabacter salinae]|uniref:lytic murein transglycosylase n=1 Tax=Anianabacter salinae TaxID=2851023 RepID=UPI00225DE359|nr:lytic murein transglycosylase [Anianabacter salinae]MBV0913383.1 lytic murein transglycosylase [Anianabacter salinae]
MNRLILTLVLGTVAGAAMAQSAVERSLFPIPRPEPVAMSTSATPPRPIPRPVNEVSPFTDWIAQFRGRALAQGIRADVFDGALSDATFLPDVIKKDRNQSEFTKPIWDYLDSAVSRERVTNGRAALKKRDALLTRIEARYGVEKEVVAAVWGLESAYGTFRGSVPIVSALATLASDSRRSAFFEAELLNALRILQDGQVQTADMRGSWAGAMGHTQFMPSSYLAFAHDFDGDGRCNIWGDDPADALALTAAYLSRNGWTKGQPWGVEVTLPEGFDYDLTSERVKKPVGFWTGLGITDTRGKPVPDHGRASILLPAGHRGAAFMIFDNFHVLETYNTADAYVIGVGHLSDRLVGGDPIRHGWPRDDKPLSFDQKIEMQRLLTALGFDTDGTDGIIGPNTIAAVKAWQGSIGLVPDGYASADTLRRLR